MRYGILAAVLLLATGSTVAAEPVQRTLTFDDRVKAQEQIDVVYRAELTGPAETPAVARARAEAKVLEALKKSIMLATRWKTPITGEALRRELERIARNTAAPDRLRALYAALGNDPLVIEEALARPVLVDRLVANFFAYDERIHASTRAEAEKLRLSIGAHATITDLGRATKTEHELRRADEAPGNEFYERSLRDLPRSVAAPGFLRDERTEVTFDVAVELGPDLARFERYSVPKVGWNTWWTSASAALDDATVRATAAVPTSHGNAVKPPPDPRTPSCDPGGYWDNGSLGLLLDPRFGHTAVWTGTELLIWGGFDFFGYFDDGARYDPLTDTWRRMAVVGAPSARADHQAVWTGEEMIVWGGTSANGLSTAGGRYHPATDTWSPLSDVGAPPGGGVLVWTGTEMIVWNGTSSARYDPSTDAWSSVATSGAPAGGAAVWTGTEMIVWGNGMGARYHPDTDTWAPMSTSGGPTFPTQLLWAGDEMIAWDSRGHGGLYNPASDSWSPMAPSDLSTSGSASVWTGTDVIVFTGSDHAGRRYDPRTDTWAYIYWQNTGYAEWGTKAVWTGTYMLVWGGVMPSQGSCNSGGRYDVIADAWTPISTNGAPRSYGATAVWTPVGMVTWSGNGTPTGTDCYNSTLDAWHSIDAPVSGQAVWTGSKLIWWNGSSGGVLDLLANTWSPIPVGGPTWSTVALWTGHEAIFWAAGGGARFDPATESWNPIPGYGSNDATAIWTGSEMIAFSSGAGARLSLVNSTWIPISSVDAPPISATSATWTGDEMVVWGGRGPAGTTNLGGRYDPTNDTWRPTSTVDAPSPRWGPSTIWTGHEMVVWGGAFGEGIGLDTGGRYDPVTDRWAAVSLIGTPLGRSRHALVWTGQAVIAWGGVRYLPNVYLLDVGGRLFLDQLYDDDADGRSECDGDCNDSDATVGPGAPQLCDGKNNDCSDPFWPALPANEADADGDGFRICQNDCSDVNSSIHPGATESCNSLDDNCNGGIDEDAQGVDSDGDGIHNACDNCRLAFNPTQVDTDGDRVGNACDNCALLANPNQADADSDQRGDVCDNCPTAYNPLQDDLDGDHIGDACDDCVFDFNPGQSDFDHDNEGDVCDLNDGLIFVYGTDDKNYIEWQAESGYTTWNSYRGSLAVLRATGQYTQAPGSNPLAGRDCGVSDPYAFDAFVPGPGEVEFSLVTGVAGGVESGLGTSSAGVPRANANPCP